jgi:hypothetical protein
MKELIAEDGYVFVNNRDKTIYAQRISLPDNVDITEWIKCQTIDGKIIELPIWHDDTSSIQIKLTHIDNANMLKKYPVMANYGGVLPCYIEEDFVYLYCNYITEEDRIKLTEFNSIINTKS